MESDQNSKKPSRPRLYYGWYLVAIAWIMAFLQAGTAINLYFKPILDEFGWSRASLSLVSAVALMVIAVLSPFIGKLIDRFGPRLIMLATVLAQSLSAAINGLSANLGQIYIGRFLYEFRPTHSSQVLLNHWFVKLRGRALGIASTGIPLGTLLISPFAQYLILIWGWRPSLLFWAGVILVVMMPLLIFVKNRPVDKGLNPDGLESDENKNSSESIPKLEVRKVGGLDFSQTIKSKAFWLLSGTQLVCGIGCGFIGTHLVIFATDIGYSAMIGAVFNSVIGGANLVGVLIAGHVSDYQKRNKVLSLTHLLRSLSFVIVAVAIILGGGPLWLLFLAMAMFGMGWFTTAPLAAALAADMFGYRYMGTILGLVMSFHYVGMAIGALGGGVVFTQTGSYLIVFIAQGGLELLAAIGAFVITKQR